jgi:membrane-bound lytic murein transglycosylase F
MRPSLFVTMAVCAALHAAPPAAASLAEIAADGKLTVIYADADSPFLDEGPAGPQGFDYDVLQGFATRLGLTVTTVVVREATDLLPALRAGRGELIAGAYTHTPERAREVLFTGEVTPQRHVVLTLDPAPPVTSLERLRELRVGTVAATSWEVAARAAGIPAERIEATLPFDTEPFLAAYREKELDAAVTGLFYALMLLREEPRARIGLVLGEAGYHGYAMLPGHEELRDALDDYLRGVRDTAGWYRIVIKHFGTEAPEIFRRARTE